MEHHRYVSQGEAKYPREKISAQKEAKLEKRREKGFVLRGRSSYEESERVENTIFLLKICPSMIGYRGLYSEILRRDSISKYYPSTLIPLPLFQGKVPLEEGPPPRIHFFVGRREV